MARSKCVEETHERILQGALEVFSEKGYSAATIKDISNRAGCNTVTIFRHFEDKLGLFLEVVERFHEFTFDKEYVQSKLSYTNVHADLSVMARLFFEAIYQNIHILRIYINDGHNFEPISKYLWYLPTPLKDFVEEYLEAIYLNVMTPGDISLIAEMFISYITRTCLRFNVHHGYGQTSGKIKKEAKETMSVSVDMIVNLIMLQIHADANNLVK